MITAWRLMFSSFAALSSSSSIGDAKSTFTRWIGPIMRPALVKKGETSFPLSASRAMFSADTGFFYVTKKNARTMTEKMVVKKYDPVVRKHVEFKEGKIK